MTDAPDGRSLAMEVCRTSHRVDIETVYDTLVKVVTRGRNAPFGSQRRHADAVCDRLESMRVDIINLMWELDDCFAWDERRERRWMLSMR